MQPTTVNCCIRLHSPVKLWRSVSSEPECGFCELIGPHPNRLTMAVPDTAQLLPDPARLLDLGSGVSDSHSPSGSSREVALRRPDNLQAGGRILFPDVHCGKVSPC